MNSHTPGVLEHLDAPVPDEEEWVSLWEARIRPSLWCGRCWGLRFILDGERWVDCPKCGEYCEFVTEEDDA